MSAERKLLAVQLANQRLVEAQQKAQGELDRLRAENQQLKQMNSRLREQLVRAEKLSDTLKTEYRQVIGKDYSGKMQITKFGFQKSA